MVRIDVNISNRLLYTIIAGVMIILVGASVYALTAGVAPNPGHVITSVAPPSGCASGEYLKWTGSNWDCAAVSGGSGVWTVSGDNIYYGGGINEKVGIGTTSPSGAKLHVEATGIVGGIKGASGQQYGVMGSTIDGRGIYGLSTGTGYAGYFEGKTHMNGLVNINGKLDVNNNIQFKAGVHTFEFVGTENCGTSPCIRIKIDGNYFRIPLTSL